MKHGPAWLITALVGTLFALFFFYPAGKIVMQAFADGDGFTFDFITAVFQHPIYREGLWNSFLLGISSTVAAMVIAFPLALLGHRYDFFAKPVLGMLVLVPMILPPFVGAVGVKQMLGVNGSINAALLPLGWMDTAAPFDWLAEGRFPGMVLMIALHVYPILYLNIAAALSHLDPALEQAAENLGCPPWRRFFRITLPLAMPGVFAGASLVFIAAFTELGVPLVFDYGRTTSVQIFDGLKGLDHNPIPYALTTLLLAVAVLVFATARWVVGRSALGAAPRPKGPHRARRLHGWKSAACATPFAAVFCVAAIPHLGVILLSLSGRWYGTVVPDVVTARHYVEALGHGLVVPSIQNSLLYAGCAVLLALFVGLGTASVVVRSRLPVRGLLDALVMMPLAVPGLVLAFGYLALSQEGKLFHRIIGPGGDPFLVLVLAYAIRRLPYVVRSAVAGLQQSNPALEEAARSLGATPLRTLRRVTLPLMGTHLAAGCLLAFAFAMLEVSDSLILAQQSQHYPITKAMYSLLSTLGNGTELAAALGVWSMVFLSTALVGAVTLGGKKGGWFKV
jgi:iron(III) transport system permease protein